METLAQDLSAPVVIEVPPQRLGQCDHDGARSAGRLVADISLVGKIDRRLAQRLRLDQLRAPALVQPRQRPASLPPRLPRLRLGLRVHQVGYRLGLGQVDLAVLEGAPRELARLCQPRPGDRAERPQHRQRHSAPAVHVELGHVLAGLAVRPCEPEHQPLIQHLACLWVPDVPQRRPARGSARRRHALDHLARRRP